MMHSIAATYRIAGIKVPTQASYNSYTTNDALNRMKVPGDTPDEQKAKFAVYTL